MLGLLLTIVLLGLIAWAASYIPMPIMFVRLIQVVLLIVAVLYVADYFNVLTMPVGHYRRIR